MLVGDRLGRVAEVLGQLQTRVLTRIQPRRVDGCRAIDDLGDALPAQFEQLRIDQPRLLNAKALDRVADRGDEPTHLDGHRVAQRTPPRP